MQLSRVFGLDETHIAIWRDVRSGETSETAEERGQRTDDRGQTTDDRDFSVGAAFSRDLSV